MAGVILGARPTRAARLLESAAAAGELRPDVDARCLGVGREPVHASRRPAAWLFAAHGRRARRRAAPRCEATEGPHHRTDGTFQRKRPAWTVRTACRVRGPGNGKTCDSRKSCYSRPSFRSPRLFVMSLRRHQRKQSDINMVDIVQRVEIKALRSPTTGTRAPMTGNHTTVKPYRGGHFLQFRTLSRFMPAASTIRGSSNGSWSSTASAAMPGTRWTPNCRNSNGCPDRYASDLPDEPQGDARNRQGHAVPERCADISLDAD